MSSEAKRSLLSLAVEQWVKDNINDAEDLFETDADGNVVNEKRKLNEVEKEWLYSYTNKTDRFLPAEEIEHFLLFKDTMRQLRAIAYQSAHLDRMIIIPKRNKRGRVVTYLKLGWMGDTSDWTKDPEQSESSDEEWD